MPNDALETITSLTNPRIKALVKLRQARARREANLLVAEGRREVTRATDAGLEPRQWFICPSQFGRTGEAWLAAHPKFRRAEGFEVTEPVMAKASYRQHPEGVLATFEPPAWEVDAVLDAAGDQAVWLVAAGWEKPGNLGAVARSASAMGAAGIVVAGGACDPWNPNAIRASTGAVFSLPIVEMSEVDAIRALQDRSIAITVATDEAATPIDRCDLTGRRAIVIGAEDRGVSEALREAADAAVSIPMADSLTDSLNASVAAGVALYECMRQRRATEGENRG